MKPKKSLGQHWLHDSISLSAMLEAGLVHEHDHVLEIGPGLGTLTELLVTKARRVVAVEFDNELARNLQKSHSYPNLTLVNQDILKFDLTTLPANYKVVANIPYYLTSKLLRVLSESSNPPKVIALLVQKEVAERVAAGPGGMSLLSVSVQMYYEAHLEQVVPAHLFTPPPKVDSQIVQLLRRPKPLVAIEDSKRVFQLARAGFAGRRKTLENSLAAGLHQEKGSVREVLIAQGIPPTARAQELSLQQWIDLAKVLN